jgi:hypothetical protein
VAPHFSFAQGNSYDEDRCVVAGYDNGDIKLFDLRAMQLRWETTMPNGVGRNLPHSLFSLPDPHRFFSSKPQDLLLAV